MENPFIPSNPVVSEAAPAVLPRKLTFRFLGVGGAGCNVVDHLSSLGLPDWTYVAFNTDVQALSHCRTAQKYLMGSTLTHGLGAGGDPDLGKLVAEKDAAEMARFCAGADVVILAAGMGGGTGTGAAPVLARLAKEAGALVLAYAILPFECEGKRRFRQAIHGLHQLKAAADGVICLPNQRLGKLTEDNTNLAETFRLSNELLAQTVRGLWRMLAQPGLINVDFAHVCSALRGQHTESFFATVEAQGPNRAREVVEKLWSSPLLQDGPSLASAETVLVSLTSKDLTRGEVDRILEPINRQCENAHLILGATIEESFNDRIELTLIASVGQAVVEPGPESEGARRETAEGAPSAAAGTESDPPAGARPAAKRSTPRLVPPPPELSPEKARQLLQQQPGSRFRKVMPRLRQGQLPLEIISKGRFEKSDPTVHHGEDLDVPTFKRRRIPLN